jgi:putative component of membrane protein insertase Oxa1/YidC/SpoIIIJ protein YidD
LRRLLAAAIGLYRRHLSGRGSFRGVRCTFEQCESCSEYGERMVREAPSALTALARIRRRLRRCRQLSLYRLSDSGLGWGSGYDGLMDDEPDRALQDIDAMLAEDAEEAHVRQAVGRAAAEVMISAGTRRRRIPGRPGEPRLLLRDAGAAKRALACRVRLRLAAAVLLATCGASFWVGGFMAPALPLVFGAGVVAAFTMPSRRLRSRLERMEVFHAIDGPSPSTDHRERLG